MYEFNKLNPIDIKVASWLHSECPEALFAYLEFIANNDYHRKGIKINADRIFCELLKSFQLYAI